MVIMYGQELILGMGHHHLPLLSDIEMTREDNSQSDFLE